MNKMTQLANRIRGIKINEFWWRVITILYAAFIIAINFVRVFDNDFWGDEAFSIRLAKLPVGKMLAETAADVHPPLYYINLILANRLMGNHGWVYHLVSFIPFVILVVFALTTIKKHFGREASLLFVTFIGISTEAIKFNVEARMYSLAAMYVLLAYFAFLKVLKEEKYGCLLFVIFSLGAAYSHYYAMMSVAVLYFALLIQTVLKKFELKKLILIYTSTIVGYIPWLWQMIIAFSRTSKDFWMTDVPGFFESLVYYFYSNHLWYSWGMLIITIVCIALIIIKDIKQNDKDCNALDITTVWLLWGVIAAIGTLAIGEVISIVFRPAFMVRYLYPIAPVMWLALCVGLSKVKYGKQALYVLMLITLFVYGLMYVGTYSWDHYLDKKCRSTQEQMQEMISDEDVILTDINHLEWTILDYYIPDTRHKMITTGFEGFDEGTTYWLAWSEDFTDDDIKWIDSMGYSATEVICDGILGTNEVHIYKLLKD